MATVIDGKTLAAKVRQESADEVGAIVAKGGRAPCLAVILQSDDEASAIYVRNKKRACEESGITSLSYTLPTSGSQEELLSLIKKLNDDDNVDGILVQLPLPSHIDSFAVIESIDPAKDVDGFTTINAGLLSVGRYCLTPCTPTGVMRMLDEYDIPISGRNCVVIGRSNIVGKPMANLLLSRSGTVTVCHSKTKNLAEYTKKADIIVCAVGKAGLLTGDMISEGCTIIDVGMNRFNGKLCGDCDYESCFQKAAYITPVPGGVGPMTIAELLKNTVQAYKARKK